MIEFKDNYIYDRLKDIFIRDGKKLLKIFYGGNGDLYFDIFGDRKELDSQNYEYIAEFLIKNGNEEWSFFNKLIDDIINDKDINKDKLVKGNIVNWYSDEIYDEKANKLSIERLNEGIKLTFLNNPDDPNFGFGIRICNSGSKYNPLNLHFMNMYNEFQILSKNKEREKIEQILKSDIITEQGEQIIFDIIPELKAEKDFLQNNPWHIYDVWNHTKKVCENSKADKEIRLVLLLHDIGKPHSYQDDESGIRHFKGHSQKSAEMSKTILERLGYTEQEIKEMCFLISNHDKTIQPEVINAGNLETYKKLLYIQYCDASGYNPEYIQRVYDRLDMISSYLKAYEERNIDKKVDEEER